MKISKLLFVITIIISVVIGCKKGPNKVEDPKANIEQAEGSEKLALNISGMTCEIGCAKMIESKLAKQDGVVDAKVIFNDSLAKISYDPSKTNKASLISLVEGLAGNMYKASEVDSKKSCEGKTKEECAKSCKQACCDDKACDKKKKESACSAKDAKSCPTAECAEACKIAKEVCTEKCEKKCCA